MRSLHCVGCPLSFITVRLPSLLFSVATCSQVYSSMKPTTKLVIVVSVMCLVMRLAVAGTAIGVQYNSDINDEKDTLQHGLRLVLNAIEGFTVTESRQEMVASDFLYASFTHRSECSI